MGRTPIDKSKKSNVYCEHCEHYDRFAFLCKKTNKEKFYYQRCKGFEWKHDACYKEEVDTNV